MTISFLNTAVVGGNVVNSWNLYLLRRQYSALDAPYTAIPEKYRATITEEQFNKANAYSRDRLKFSMWSTVFKNFFVENLEMYFKLPAKLWNFTSSRFNLTQGSLAHCTTYGIFSELLDLAVTLPWSYYNTFVLEAKHGFNKSTLTEFIKDKIKVFCLKTLVLNPIISFVVNFIVKRFGAQFPMYLFGASAGLMTAATFLVPTLIMPLFNKFTPLKEGPLKTEIDNLAAELKFPLTKVFEVDGSRRSAHSNAYFYGFFNNKRIVLFDTLLKQLSDNEIIAVLCHEFGHWYHSHTLQMFGASLVQLFSFCQAAKLVMFNDRMYRDFGFSDSSPYIGLGLFSTIFLEPLSEALGMGMSVVSRRYEFQADRFAVDQGRGEALRTALLAMQKENSINLSPDWLYAACRYSHPPMIQRLQAIDELLARGAKKGE